MTLTREQAVAELVRDGVAEARANATLDNALVLYPQSVRTSVHMVTGYAKGRIADAHEVFTICRW